MARQDEHRRESGGVPRPNELAEGRPLPNVLRDFAPPNAPGAPAGGPARVDRPTQRPTPKPERRPADEPAVGRRRAPGCGCGGWLGLVALLALLMRLVGACDEILAPEAPSPSATGSAATEGSLVDARLLGPGDCLRWPDGTTGVTVVHLVDCSLAHDAEVAGLATLPDSPGTPYDDQAIQAAAEVRCNATFTHYAGEPAVMSADRHSSFIYPGEAGWGEGDRSVTCLVEGDEPRAPSSARPATTPPEPTGTAAQGPRTVLPGVPAPSWHHETPTSARFARIGRHLTLEAARSCSRRGLQRGRRAGAQPGAGIRIF